MWRPDTSKQRLWLGPDRHRGRRGHTITNTEPESYANSNSYAVGVRSDVTYTNRDCNCDSHTNSHCHANSNGHSYCYRNGYG